MAIGIQQSPNSPGNWWCWPPTSCLTTRFDPLDDWFNAIEAVETDPDSY